ncbi:MAG: MBL fold metallo-hydrolase [Magnetospirillum sp. WYHS-4]
MDRDPGKGQEGYPLNIETIAAAPALLGETAEVAPGILWHRQPLPFKLDHINLWLLEDGDGWCAVDTGIDLSECRAAWGELAGRLFGGRPLRRMIVTHFHPDHLGLAGWLRQRFGTELWMTLGEWATGRMLALDTDGACMPDFRRFYGAAGFDAKAMAVMETRGNPYPERVHPIPAAYRRLNDGDEVPVGGRTWRVIVGRGHSPEHAALYCAEAGVLISGDQVLPRISPNISVWPQEPEADPLRLFLDSLSSFRTLPGDTLVLPSHDRPFRGLSTRLEQLARHHDARLAETLEACAEPRTAVDILRRLFRRDLDDHQLFFAIGESLAHLHFLMGEGQVERLRRADAPDLYRRCSPAI